MSCKHTEVDKFWELLYKALGGDEEHEKTLNQKDVDVSDKGAQPQPSTMFTEKEN